MSKSVTPPRKDYVFVVLQFALFIVYIFRIPAIDLEVASFMRNGGLYLALLGSVVALLAFLYINTSLSPFPTPKSDGKLVRSGIYKYIRHPIYSGILGAALGFSFYSENTLRFVIFLCLAVLFIFKARYEERLLKERYPDYGDYQSASGMFLPRWKL